MERSNIRLVSKRSRLMDQSVLLDEPGGMLVVAGLICVVLLVPMMMIGLIISVIQAATSISQQSLSLVPQTDRARRVPGGVRERGDR